MQSLVRIVLVTAVLTAVMLLGAVALGATGIVCAATAGCPHPRGVPAECDPANGRVPPGPAATLRVIAGVEYLCGDL